MGDSIALAREAFLIKYGYSLDLAQDELLTEFRRRYTRAHALLSSGFERFMRAIEGIPAELIESQAHLERELRGVQLRSLGGFKRYSITELERLADQFAARLEAEWIREALGCSPPKPVVPWYN